MKYVRLERNDSHFGRWNRALALLVPLTAAVVSCGSTGDAILGSTDPNGGNGPLGASDGSADGPDRGTISFDGCAAVVETAANTYDPADIVFIVDNSPSMRDEIEWTRAKLNDFSARIKNLDHRIVMISCADGACATPGGGGGNFTGICIPSPLGAPGGCDGAAPHHDSNPPLYLHVEQRIPSRRGLEVAVQTYDSWKTMLRPQAGKHFVIITDDGSDWTADQFNAAVLALDPAFAGYHLHGIFSFQSKEDGCAAGTACCQYAAPGGAGSVYASLAASTGGVTGDLCAQDFAPLFDKFADSVVASAKLSCQWAIPAPPQGQTLDPSLVNVTFADSKGNQYPIGRVLTGSACSSVEHGWYYDDPSKPTAVLTCPQTCGWIQGQPGARMDLYFGCETQMAPVK
jgi:hypothetical protein